MGAGEGGAPVPAQPPTVVCKMEAQLEYTQCIVHVFARLAPICNAQPVLINKISAVELSLKFIKSALLVGCLCVIVSLSLSLALCATYLQPTSESIAEIA